MSKKRIVPNVAIEWSPTHVSWIGENHSLVTVGSLREAAALLPGRDLLVGVSRRTAFVRAYRVPNAPKPDVLRILSMQIGQLFPIPASELAFDFHLTHDVNAEGKLAIVAAMKSADLHSLHEQARAAGLRVARVVPAAMGSPLLAHALNHPSAAVVHRTAEGLAIDLVVDNELRYSRVATMPANSMGIEAEISRTFAAAVLSCSPTIAAGALALPDAEASTDTWSLEKLLGGHIDIDLETPEQVMARERSKQRQRLRFSLLLLAAALLTFTGVYLDYDDKVTAANQDVPFWNSRLTKLRKSRDSIQKKASDFETLKANLDRGFHPAQSFSDVFTIASNATPQGVWLTGMSLERGKVLSIRGTATKGESVYQFQQALVSEPRFRDVKLVFANNTEIDNTPVVQFSITLFPIGNLPLIDPDAKKKVATRR